MTEGVHSGPWPGRLRPALSRVLTLSTPSLHPLGHSLIALGHLQVAEVGDALHVGVEGKEATQEVVPSQVEVGVLYQLGWLGQSVQQKKQQAESPRLGPHVSEATALEDALACPWSWSPHAEAFAQTFT